MNQQRQMKPKVVQQLLQLQELFHSRFLTIQLLNQLVALYVESIQCFDGKQSAMRNYFLSKIHFVLSRPEVNNMLERNQNSDKMVDNIRQTMRTTGFGTNNQNLENINTQDMIMQVIQEENTNRKKKSNAVQNQNSNKVPENTEQVKLKERHGKIQMQMKIMREIQQNMKNLKEEVIQSQSKNFKKQKKINQLVQKQNDDLESRLARRRKNRKKSAGHKELLVEQEKVEIIKKQDLKQAQKQIQRAIVRMTIRLTQKNAMNGILPVMKQAQSQGMKQKGRVKKRQIVEQEQEQQELLSQKKIQQKKPIQKQEIDEPSTTSKQRITARYVQNDKGRVTFRKRNLSNEQEQQEQCF